jgi:mannosidase alpha-like ER degradation enhancer 2
LEFGTLSKLTGRAIFYDKAKRALVETFMRRSPLGLVGQSINVETGAWTNTDSHISGGIDSYYEYLWKSWLLFGDKDCRDMWKPAFPPLTNILPTKRRSGLWYGHADMRTGKRSETNLRRARCILSCLARLSGDLARARRLQASSFKMWNLYGIEPEILDYKTMRVVAGSYHLRPEIVESTYYLYHYTGDPEYRHRGRKCSMTLSDIAARIPGYAALADVTSKQQLDEMESFVLAETFKYFYLLFAPAGTLEFEKVIFNTEAHPLRRMR